MRWSPLARMKRAGIEMLQTDIDVGLGISRVHPHSNILCDVTEFDHLPAGFEGTRTRIITHEAHLPY